jgi:hypothetical protein
MIAGSEKPGSGAGFLVGQWRGVLFMPASSRASPLPQWLLVGILCSTQPLWSWLASDGGRNVAEDQ